jgi:hypothetical protein
MGSSARSQWCGSPLLLTGFLVCVPTSLSQEVGAALGAQAGEQKLREVIVAGGFGSRQARDLEAPHSFSGFSLETRWNSPSIFTVPTDVLNGSFGATARAVAARAGRLNSAENGHPCDSMTMAWLGPDTMEEPFDAVARAVEHRAEAGYPAAMNHGGMFGAAPAGFKRQASRCHVSERMHEGTPRRITGPRSCQ